MKKYLSLCLILVLSLSLCACGNPKMKEAELPAAAPVFSEANITADYAQPALNVKAESFGSAYNAAPAAGIVQEKNGPGEGAGQEFDPDKIIYSADVTVETTDFDETVKKVSELIGKYRGWVEASSVSGSDYYSISRGRGGNRSAGYTLRIPFESFDDAMSGLGTLGNVPYSRTYTENVTAAYYDTQARLESLKTQEQSLLRLMEKAEEIGDVIAIEEKLSDVRYHIESLQASLNNMDRKVAYSYIYLTVNEVAEYTPEKAINPGFGERFVQAVKDGFSAAGDFLSDMVIFTVEALPTLVMAAAVIFALFLIIRSTVRRKKAKKAAKKAETLQESEK